MPTTDARVLRLAMSRYVATRARRHNADVGISAFVPTSAQPPAAPRPRRRTAARRDRAAAHPAPARPLTSVNDRDIPGRHRYRGNHLDSPRAARADDARQRRARPVAELRERTGQQSHRERDTAGSARRCNSERVGHRTSRDPFSENAAVASKQQLGISAAGRSIQHADQRGRRCSFPIKVLARRRGFG